MIKSKKFDEKREALILKFININLPLRIKEIENIIQLLLNTEYSNEFIENLKNLSHRLNGVCGIYGLNDISVVASKIEKFSNGFDNMSSTLSIMQRQIIDNLLSELKIAASNPTEDKSIELLPIDNENEKFKKSDFYNKKTNTEENKETSKIIFLIEQNDIVSQNLTRQFSVYGYKSLVVSNFTEMIDYIDNESGEIIIIINTSFLDKSEFYNKIVDLKKRKQKNLILAFISDHGDFNMRLKAVKAEADAYFVLPLDVSELIEKLNTFSVYNKPYHILIVDDDPDLVAYYAHILQQQNMITSVVSNPLEVVSQIILNKPELILMDLNMPGCNGWELSKIIRQQEAFVSIPIIFLSTENNVEKQFKALRNGGDDFIPKNTPDNEMIESIKIRADRYRTLRFYMERDSLTGLLNHTRTIEHLTAEINKAIRREYPLSFAMLDLDNFKKVNDKYGHMIGDKVLKRLACLLKERLRKSDIIGRYGGEEFSIIFPDTDGDKAYLVLDQIRKKFAEMEHKAPDALFNVTLSAGIASISEKNNFLTINEMTDDITEMADQALYKAKNDGRNRVVQDKNNNSNL